jgi:hypothetical protein
MEAFFIDSPNCIHGRKREGNADHLSSLSS